MGHHGGSRRPDGPQEWKKSGGEPFEIDGWNRDVSLELHVVDATPSRALDPIPAYCSAILTLGTPICFRMESRSRESIRQRRRVARHSMVAKE